MKDVSTMIAGVMMLAAVPARHRPCDRRRWRRNADNDKQQRYGWAHAPATIRAP